MLNGQTQPNSVYFSLNSRPKKGEYVSRGLTKSVPSTKAANRSRKHWGVVVTDANNNPVLYHANNRTGPWAFEAKPGNPGKSMTLIVLVKIGTVAKNGIAAVMQAVPADGKPSKRSGEAFSCRTWSKDAAAFGAAKGNFVLKNTPGKLSELHILLSRFDLPHAILSFSLCYMHKYQN